MAQLAANLHALNSAHGASAVTPLSVAMGQGLRVSNATVGLFSARARHPDVRLAARAARAQPDNRVVLLTQLQAAGVSPRLAAVVDEVITLPLTTKDGFLATNSIVAMATAWLKAAGIKLPETLPMLEVEMPAWPKSATRALVMYGPDQLAAARDLEARLSETGLLDVQLADLRNVAHGRHVGLLSRANSVAIIALGDPGSQALVNRTLDVLPTSIRVVDLSTKLDGPVGALDVIVGGMRLVGDIGGAQGIDPGQPRVSSIGRKLYHLPWSRLASGPDGLRPPRSKALAAGMTYASAEDMSAWTTAWRNWSARVAGRPVAAVVLDYDGTCVPTHRRTKPPSAEVQAEIVRLLEQGLRIAVASGRGPSVIEELQRWVPRELWDAVVVGIYNGAVVNPLRVLVGRGIRAGGDLQAAAQLLSEQLVGNGWSVSERRWQVTVERPSAPIADVAACVAATLAPEFGTRLKVLKSGHSVDVVPLSTSKRGVVEHLGLDISEVLLIGDQGEPGGNDFELLSYSDLSLSVDKVSADPARCWNLSEDGASGPVLLTRYLRALQTRGRKARFVWRPTTLREPR